MTQADLLPVTAKSKASSAIHSGANRRDAGMQQVLDNEKSEWLARAIFLAKSYLSSMPDDALFAIEDIRAYFDVCGLPSAHHHNVYGSLPRVLIKAGLPMVPTDCTRKAHSPRTHAHRVALYRKVAVK